MTLLSASQLSLQPRRPHPGQPIRVPQRQRLRLVRRAARPFVRKRLPEHGHEQRQLHAPDFGNSFVGAFTNIASGNRLDTSDGWGPSSSPIAGSNLFLSDFIAGMGPNLVTANWLNPTSGTWNTPANWSSNPNFPNNGTPSNTVYNAVIAATGAPYTVTLDQRRDGAGFHAQFTRCHACLERRRYAANRRQ